VRTERDDVVGPGRILAFTDGPAHQNWLVGQEGDALAVRHRGREAWFPHALAPGETHAWQILFEGEQVTLLDRGGHRETRRLVGRKVPWKDGCRLTLGNELTGDRPWGGEIRALSLHETVRPRERLDLVTTDGDLRLVGREGERIELEPVGWPWAIKVRRSLETATRADPFDVTRNVLMTIPYGFFLALCLRRRRLIQVLAILLTTQFVVTLSAEFLQLFSLNRYPTPSDFVANAVGALAGLAVARRLLRQKIE
jgi:VanZ family protein